MRGDRVVVRGFEEKPYVVRVWRELGATVEIVSDEAFGEWQGGRQVMVPVGFRRRDVFRFEGGTLSEPVKWEAIPEHTA